MATLSVFSEAGDGDITSGPNSTWATVRGAGHGLSADGTDDNGNCYLQREGGGDYYIRRLQFPFDTSALGAGATITAADFDVYYENAGTEGISGAEYGIVEGDMASSATLSTGDWTPANFTRLATDKPQGDFSSAGYYTYALNATGLSIIDKTGDTFLAMLHAQDIDDTAPSTGASYKSFRFSEFTGDTNDPQLTVEYTAAPTNEVKSIAGISNV